MARTITNSRLVQALAFYNRMSICRCDHHWNHDCYHVRSADFSRDSDLESPTHLASVPTRHPAHASSHAIMCRCWSTCGDAGSNIASRPNLRGSSRTRLRDVESVYSALGHTNIYSLSHAKMRELRSTNMSDVLTRQLITSQQVRYPLRFLLVPSFVLPEYPIASRDEDTKFTYELFMTWRLVDFIPSKSEWKKTSVLWVIENEQRSERLSFESLFLSVLFVLWPSLNQIY